MSSRFLFTICVLFNVSGCGVLLHRDEEFYPFYSEVLEAFSQLYILPFGLAMACFFLASICRKAVDESSTFLLLFVSGNIFLYSQLGRVIDLNFLGAYLAHCFFVLKISLVLFLILHLYRISKGRRDEKRLFSTAIVLVLVFLINYWAGFVYRLGAGECILNGERLSSIQIFQSLSDRYLENIEISERAGHVYSVENIIKNAYSPFVEMYLKGDYQLAVHKMPTINYAPDSFYYRHYDDYLFRIVNGNSYSQVVISSDGSDRNKYMNFLISSCGEIYPLSHSSFSNSIRNIWSR